MKLLYTITAYPPSTGGAQLHQHMLARQMMHRHDVQVVSQWNKNRTDWLLGTTLRAPGTKFDYTIDAVKVHRLGLAWQEKLRIAPFVPIYYPLMSIALPRIAACLENQLLPFAAEADLIHNVRTGREGLSYASYNVARKRNLPFVFTSIHHPRWIGWRYRAFIRLCQAADAVIALTEAEKRTLIILGVEEDRIAVTGIGPVLAPRADGTAFVKKHKIEGPMVLFIGQHYLYKGYGQILGATRLVWQRIPEAEFVFIGPAVGNSEREFKSFADKRIHRLGTVDLQEKSDALAACSLLCVPSTQESFGGVYTEAWSFSKPVIGCNIPAVAEVISDGVDGYLVAQEPAQIAERICYLLPNPAKAQAMGAAGSRKVQERYTWKRIAELTEQAYGKVVRA